MKRFKRVYVEITNVCNLKCQFCDVTKRKQEVMSIENIKRVFENIKEYTDYVYLHVKGEPLLYPKLSEVLEAAEYNNLKVVITTNGTLLKDKAEILAKAKNIRQLNISLHSIEQNPDLNIDKKQYFKELFDAVEEITKGNNCFISYRLWNLDDINENGKNVGILNWLKEYYNMPQLLELVKDNDFVEIGNKKYINLDTIYEWPSLEKDIVSTSGNCYGLVSQLAVLVDGTVVPCCLDQNGDINLGNIFESSLENILNSETASKIVDGFKCNKLINPLCQRCGFRELKRR